MWVILIPNEYIFLLILNSYVCRIRLFQNGIIRKYCCGFGCGCGALTIGGAADAVSATSLPPSLSLPLSRCCHCCCCCCCHRHHHHRPRCHPVDVAVTNIVVVTNIIVVTAVTIAAAEIKKVTPKQQEHKTEALLMENVCKFMKNEIAKIEKKPQTELR
jgi:hypothetical protein